MERPVRKAIFTSLVLLLGFALPSFGQSAVNQPVNLLVNLPFNPSRVFFSVRAI